MPVPRARGAARALSLACLLLCSALYCSCMGRAASEPIMLHFQVEPQSESCLLEDIDAGVEVGAYTMVYRGGKLDIKLRIEGPDQRVMYESLLFSNIDDSDGSMLPTIVRKGSSFTAPVSGAYTFCLDNRMAKWTAKVLTFELEVARAGQALPPPPPVVLEAQTESASAVAAANLKEIAHRMHMRLLQIEGSQYYHYHREQRHRETVESTDRRVVGWTVASASVVTVTSVVMSVIVRRWFSQPSLPGARP